MWVVKIVVSSFIIAVTISVTLSYRCNVRPAVGFRSGICIGLFVSLFVMGMHLLAPGVPFFFLLVSEFFLVLFILLIAIAFRFYRDPERVPPRQQNIIVSPADGTVRYVQKLKDGEIPFSEKKNRIFPLVEMTKTDILSEGAFLIGIEMSVLDVHVNRAPIQGTVVYQKPADGPFLSLRKPEALFCNERVTTVIDNGLFRVGVIQIASRLVRRIVSYLSEGMEVRIGQRMGMIKFGSQVDIVIPKLEGVNVRIQQGEQVEAGTTIICDYGSSTQECDE
ncbi:MAG: phosphatidylserine decarboxylase [bacterium]